MKTRRSLPANGVVTPLRKPLNAVVGLTTSVLVFMGGFAAEAVNPKYTAGVAAFNGKNFRAAVSAFGDVVRAEPRNVSAVYYLAMSYYSLGQVTAALGYFRWLADNYPGTVEGARARSLMERLGAQAAARGETLGSHPSGGGGHGLSAPHAVASEGGHDEESAGYVSPESIIVVVKNLADHPPVEKSMLDGIKQTLKQFPPGVVAFIYGKGVRVMVTPTAIDYEPSLLNTHPRGYEDGKNFKNVPAYFDGRNVIVCNYALRGGDDWEPTVDPNGSLRHEFGHALDQFLGNLTDRDDFKLTYYKDVGKMTPEQKDDLAYYVQKAEGGPSECFAECVCTIFGGRGKEATKYRTDGMKAAFPNVIKYIEGKLAALR